MKCPSCGQAFDDGAPECPACGLILAKWAARQPAATADVTPAGPAAAPPLAVAFLVIAPLAFAAVGGTLTVRQFRELKRAEASSAWPRAAGKVIFSDVATWRDGGAIFDGYGKRVAAGGYVYYPAVRTSYSVGGRTYVTRRVSLGGGSVSLAAAEALAARYPAGSAVAVYYDPARPRDAVLEPGVAAFNLSALRIGVVLLGAGVLVGALELWAARALRRDHARAPRG